MASVSTDFPLKLDEIDPEALASETGASLESLRLASVGSTGGLLPASGSESSDLSERPTGAPLLAEIASPRESLQGARERESGMEMATHRSACYMGSPGSSYLSLFLSKLASMERGPTMLAREPVKQTKGCSPGCAVRAVVRVGVAPTLVFQPEPRPEDYLVDFQEQIVARRAAASQQRAARSEAAAEVAKENLREETYLTIRNTFLELSHKKEKETARRSQSSPSRLSSRALSLPLVAGSEAGSAEDALSSARTSGPSRSEHEADEARAASGAEGEAARVGAVSLESYAEETRSRSPKQKQEREREPKRMRPEKREAMIAKWHEAILDGKKGGVRLLVKNTFLVLASDESLGRERRSESSPPGLQRDPLVAAATEPPRGGDGAAGCKPTKEARRVGVTDLAPYPSATIMRNEGPHHSNDAPTERPYPSATIMRNEGPHHSGLGA